MARNVGDLALLLSVIAGPDPRAPLALGDPGSTFAPPLAGLARRPAGRAVASTSAAPSRSTTRSPRWSSASAAAFAGRGAHGRGGAPRPAASADDTFRTLRAWHFQATLRRAARRAPRRVQAVARRQHPGGGVADRRRRRPRLRAAHRARRADARVLRRRTTCWCCRSRRCRRSRPTRSSRPTINGRPMETYLDWMRVGVPHHRHRLPGDLGPGRPHRRRAAGRHPDRRPPRRGPVPARGRGGVRGRRQQPACAPRPSRLATSQARAASTVPIAASRRATAFDRDCAVDTHASARAGSCSSLTPRASVTWGTQRPGEVFDSGSGPSRREGMGVQLQECPVR